MQASENMTTGEAVPGDSIDILHTVSGWMRKAGQLQSDPTHVNVRRSAFQLGMQCEELAEKLAVTLPWHPVVERLAAIGNVLKAGDLDHNVSKALSGHAAMFLDGDIDLLWVTAGSIAAQGADGVGAFGEVARANWDKFPGGVVSLNADGKVLKPRNWIGPMLSPFISPNIRAGVISNDTEEI